MATLVALVLPIAATGDTQPPDHQAKSPEAHAAWFQKIGCHRGYRWRPARRGVRSVMRSPKRLTHRRGRAAWRFARCVYTRTQARRLTRAVVRLRRWRRSYPGWWRIQAMRTPYHTALSRLRACESGGHYRAVGPDGPGGPPLGGYQFKIGTWARAQWWVPGRYRTGSPLAASVDHQDVVTGRFRAAGHAGEWACSG